MLEPLWLEGRPARSGPVSKAHLVKLTAQFGLSPIAFQSFGWRKGNYWSNWVPVLSDHDNLVSNPPEMWANISSNLSRARSVESPRSLEDIAAIVDFQDHDARLAQATSLSLRMLGITVQSISEFYNERLVDSLATVDWKGHSFSTTLDQNFYAHVQSFFLHLIAARDYLGALLAHRMGFDPTARKTDSLPGLLAAISVSQVGSDPILGLLSDASLLRPHKKDNLALSGWLADAGELRNQFVHQRPYGSRFLETGGLIIALNEDAGVYRYHRRIVDWKDGKQDIFDVIVGYYKQTMSLFRDAAVSSGYDLSMLALADNDIVAIEIN